MRRLLEALLLPPLNCFVVAALGLLVRRWKPRLGNCLLVSAAVLLWLMSTPVVAAAFLASLQTEPAFDLPAAGGGAQAIVVLSADQDRRAPEYGHPTLGVLALQRVRYGAALHRATGLPLLVSGGVPETGHAPHCETMRRVLEEEYQVSVRWSEADSRDTFENASYSAQMLERDGVGRILLVTHAWHMPRARRAFEACGLEVIPAPTAFRTLPDEWIAAVVPRWTALRDSALALHEYLGQAYYELAHY